eukprot:gnl/TRDRNA2_/TRDRNA2_155956_c1_seq1.p1 gnl/TRDRNA2_/TRDRNA2_155956_c1~~gnl/TRDRNA2_/TRDRNA2_155956_c1_seq1.p1  ORF type:complete len:499 (+),score=83.51 gnl/TRDRNA2_/TRDRNA2_155956_c1_seq1:123-1499(+)
MGDEVYAFSGMGSKQLRLSLSEPHPAAAQKPTPEPRPKNQNAAALLRAQLTGKPLPSAAPPVQNQDTAALLRAQLTGKPGPHADAPATRDGQASRPVVKKVLPQVDARGKRYRYEKASNAASFELRRKFERSTDDATGNARAAARTSAADLARLEKADRSNYEANFGQTVLAAGKGYQDIDDAMNDWDIQGGDKQNPRKAKQLQQEDERRAFFERKRAIEDMKRLERAESSEWLRTHPELIVTTGAWTYLMPCPTMPLAEGHCYIVVAAGEHSGSTRALDEGAWEEVRNFKKCLVRMFAKRGQAPVFMETAMHLDRAERCLVECIPVPQEMLDSCPAYFKQSFDQGESEFHSQHHAKRMIDTSKRGLRGSVPENFPYFHVEFGLDRGFVHVIDNEVTWSRSFGHDTVAAVLGVDVHFRGRPSLEQQRSAAEQLRKEYKPHDWTHMLQKEERLRTGTTA